MVERKWGADPRGAKLRILVALAATHRAALLAEWEHKVLVKDPGPER
jgi:hypothetical protein